MGIPRFAGALKKRVPNAFGTRLPPNVSNTYIDANSTFYPASDKVRGPSKKTTRSKDPAAQRQARRAQRVKAQDPVLTKAQFHQEITNQFELIVRRTHPENTLGIFVDGVAPIPKIQQQRGRRFKGVLERKPSDFDTNAFTPGTEVMAEIDSAIETWADSQETFDRLNVREIIYSSWKQVGEGEHKIMDLFRSGQVKGTGSTVIVGMDADLILLSLMAPIDGIVLWREDQNVRFHTVDIDALRLGLLQELKKPSSLRDFGLMAILVGNDFLPKYPLVAELDNYFDIAFQVYQEFEGELVSISGEINWDNLTLFLAGLQARENVLVNEFQSARLFQPLGAFEEAVTRLGRQFRFDQRKFSSGWYQHALGPKNPEQIQKLGLIPVVPTEMIEPMAVAYLQGMEWVMRYYLQGAPNTDQTYYYPYYYAPLLSDLVQVLQNRDHSVLIRPTLDYQMTPYEQLLAVLPIASKKLIPQGLKPLMGLKSPILDLYPAEFEIDLQGKGREHEGIALIPFAEAERIRSAVELMGPAQYHSFNFQQSAITTYNLGGTRHRPQAMVQGVGRGRGRGGYSGRGSGDSGRGRGGGRGGRGGDSGGDSGRGGRGRGGSRPRGGRLARGTDRGVGTRSTAFSSSLLM